MVDRISGLDRVTEVSPSTQTQLDPSLQAQLSSEAQAIRARSYSPYSKFAVGAALLGKSGKIYLGTNVENVSYGLSICAEVAALTRAISEGEHEFSAIAVSGGRAPEGLAPCGRCRQMLAEFAQKDDILVLMLNEQGTGRAALLSALLPLSFDRKALESAT